MAILYVLPLILANVPYWDDVARRQFGFYWIHDGRLINTYLLQFASFWGSASSLYPYFQIIAGLFFAYSGYLLSVVLGLTNKGVRIPLKRINKIFISLSFPAGGFLASAMLILLGAGAGLRTYLPVSFALMAYLFLIGSLYPRLSTLLSSVLILFSFFLMSSFSSVTQEQYDWDKRLANQVFSDLETRDTEIIFSGEAPRASYLLRLKESHPFFKRHITTFLFESKWQLSLAFVEYLNLVPNLLKAPSEERRQEVLQERLTYPVIKEGLYYLARQKGKTIIIDFKI